MMSPLLQDGQLIRPSMTSSFLIVGFGLRRDDERDDDDVDEFFDPSSFFLCLFGIICSSFLAKGGVRSRSSRGDD